MRRLRRIRHGTLRLRDGDAVQGVDGEVVDIAVHDARFYRELALRGTLGAGEAYLRGWWSCPDLVNLFRLLARNADALSGMDGGPARLWRWLGGLFRRRRRNTLAGSRRNIAEHYDLGNHFYELFLDETMTYSAGLFEHPEASLAEASIAKYERICRKLRLSPGDHILEIGSGWGGFALHAARRYGCRVTSTTISQAQHEYCRRKVREAGLGEFVNFVCEDYRALTGRFHKLVSIEMIEAVGHEYLDVYFRKCSELLADDGMMLMQAITIPEQRYDSYRRSEDFIQRYIFPGGCLPSLGAITASLGRVTDLRLTHLLDFAEHYAATLACWRERFWNRIDAIRGLGFDERFIRMWHYYLCYCEAGFRERQIGVAQILLEKPTCRSAARGEPIGD